jgi:polysaccharide pyruvyl transferase CsaB
LKRIFLTGYYGFHNTGDEAILTSIVHDLRALDPTLQITATSAEPEITAATHNIQAIRWSDTLAMVSAVRMADLVIVGGGGIFHDYWGFDPNALLTDNHWGIAFYTAPAVLGSLYGKPVMLYGIGVGPLLSDHGKRFTKVAADAAQVITVRDAGSKDMLEALGVCPDKIRVTADPVFAFAAVRQLRNEANSGKTVIGVALRPWEVGVYPSFWGREVARGLDLLLQNEAIRVELIPFQRLTGSEDDLAIARRVRDLMMQKDRVAVVEHDLSPAEIVDRIASCELLIGMRLHSLIFAMLAGVPALALSYDAKVDHVMDRTGLQQFAIPIGSVDAAHLARRANEMLAGSDAIRQQITERTHELRHLAEENARIAFTALQSEPKPHEPTAETIALLTRSLETHLRESSELRAEEKRLLGEVDFYIADSKRNAEHAQQLAADKLQTEANAAAAQQAHAAEVQRLTADRDKARAAAERTRTDAQALQRRIDELSAELTIIRPYPARIHELEAALRYADEMRAKVVRSVDRYSDILEQTIVSYRNQKAWQVMLVLRKGYTLLFRQGLGSFLKWIFTWPLVGPGNLAEHDLPFPKPWNYMPEGLEAPRPVPSGPPTPAPVQAAEIAPQKLTDLVPQQKYDVVIMAIFDFDFRFQRPQQIAAEFARRGHRVFWVSPGRFLPPGDPKAYEAIPLRENLWDIHLRGNRPEMYTGALSAEQAASFHAGLSEVYKEFAIAESCVILQFPFWRQIGLRLREEFGSKVVYDCMDDWQNWTAEPRISDWNLNEERQLTREADVLVVTSQEFLERYEANGLHPVLARNAADFDFFASPRPNEVLTNHTKPIVGYYGAIADWFDLDLVTRLAESRPQYNFVLIGQVHGIDTSRLASLPNVSLLGEKNYREIPLYLSHFDVCLIPFVLNKLTKGVDPVKMYEYFSQGKPVVATNMAELAQSTDLLYIGRDFEEFATQVDHAVREDDPELRRRRIEYARANTWGARVNAIDAAIRNIFPKVSVLVVTYNGEEFLEPCFDSIQRNTGWPDYEVIVIDNKSNEATREVLKRYAAADQRFHVELLDRNSGFAGGNNIAAKNATGEYLVFLNPDTIVTPGWLERMIRHCHRDPSIGAVAAVTNFSGNETKINFDYDNVIEMHDFARKVAVERAGQESDIAVAALYCVAMPRHVWDEVGGLDDSYQVGMFEDDDFSLRIRNAGYRVIAAEDAFIHHFGNGSFAKIPSEESLRIFEQNKKRYEEKWKRTWKPHKLRAGAKPPYDEPRTAPIDFLRAGKPLTNGAAAQLALRKLHPSVCAAGVPFNPQPGGWSALVVECDNAAPGTSIVWDGTILTTTYGSRVLLTALVPADLYAVPGTREVYLLNDFGESNRLHFEVQVRTNSTTA